MIFINGFCMYEYPGGMGDGEKKRLFLLPFRYCVMQKV